MCEQLAAEFFDHAAAAVMFDECVVLFGCPVGKRLEPVCVMCDSFFQCPHTHAGSHMIGYFAVDRGSVVDGMGQGFVGFLGEILLHCLPVEDVLTIIFGYFLIGSNGFHCLSVGCFLHCIEA